MTTERPHEKKRLLLYGTGTLLLVVGLSALLLIHNHSHLNKEAEERKTRESAGPSIQTALVRESEPTRTLSLIGETRAFYSVTLYARVSGYLDRLNVDIGDRVKAGQLLAHVESPEQEQAYNSALADSINKRRIGERYAILRKRKLISQQQADQAFADADVSQANLRTQTVIRDYQNVTAPFDGVISNRYVDLGWLLQNASGSQAASQPLYALTKNDRLRIFMYVDQQDAPYVKTGDPVDISVAGENPVHLNTSVDMIAGELDPRTRTLLIEVVVDNADQKIVAGSFVQASLKITQPRLLKLPAQALVIRDQKTYVSVVEGQSPAQKLHYAKIDLAGNDGENLLIRSGVQPGEQVALNIGNKLSEGQKIRVAAPPPTQEAGQVGK